MTKRRIKLCPQCMKEKPMSGSMCDTCRQKGYREDLWGQRAETHRCKTCGYLINTKDCRGCIETRNMQYRLRKARRSGVSTPPENNGRLVTMP